MDNIAKLDHGGLKNVCPHCNKRFKKRKILQRHLNTHSDSKFECVDCTKTFKMKSSLKRHRSHVHEGVKKYKCNFCNNVSFAQQVNLRLHIERLHSNRKIKSRPFACSECECTFSRLNTLSRHKTARHSSSLNNNVEENFLNDDTVDPNRLAELVVAQLKSLEKEISCPADESLEKTNDDSAIKEKTCVDVAKISQGTIFDRLCPSGEVKTIEVQTVKRPQNHVAYVCEYCSKEFKKSYNFIRHIRTHNLQRPYKCAHCTKSFATKTQLHGHTERMHILDEKTGFISNKYKCCICELHFSSINQLDRHVSFHASNYVLKYLCPTCNVKFNTIAEFKKHSHNPKDAALEMLEHLIPEPIIFECNERIPPSADKKNFVCSMCGLRVKSEKALQKHINHHNNLKKFKCHICGRSYTRKLSLYVHQKVHNKSQHFQCAYCPKTYKSKIRCRSHMRSHLHDLLETNETETETRETSALKIKALIKALDKNAESAKFVDIEMLPKCSQHKHKNFHINVLDEEQYTNVPEVSKKTQAKTVHNCQQCSKVFQKPSDLERHMRTHTKERPFECEMCKKKFKLKSTLEDHQKVHKNHSERNKMTCQVCGKSYASKKSLSVHLRIHTGALPFKCSLCGKGFRTSGHHLSHMRAAKSKNGHCKEKIDSIEHSFIF